MTRADLERAWAASWVWAAAFPRHTPFKRIGCPGRSCPAAVRWLHLDMLNGPDA